ncbi:peroxiredoxin [Lapillicoccus sp.]|uniref:peroxiredoxin n=1 Tax=Lapillicoccus sp. TaxID=1909287 RepID=UPI0025D79E8E|nr:peroxiredoxin [Lapillicoccus sp.]
MSRATPLAVGDQAPGFTLVDQHGTPVSLSRYAGRQNVVLVFYPFAFSGICTGELREIRDNLGDFEADDIRVLAISCDSMFTLRAWADAEAHFFPLLSDFWPHGQTARDYGVFSEETGAALRGTFLVDTAGVVRWVMVKPTGERRNFDTFRDALADLRGGRLVGV